MSSTNSNPILDGRQPYENSYALSGKIMLTAIVILFFVVILMVCLHLYARWYLLRARRRNPRRTSRRSHIVFHVDTQASRGLDAEILRSLPIFVFSGEESSAIECAVCLSEFEERELGRRLPKCGHSFHSECIDMWFHSHSTCPLCRSPVDPLPPPEVRIAMESSSDSRFCEDCASSSSSDNKEKTKNPIGVSIVVPANGGDLGLDSSSFRSPMSRMLSFTRILSRDRRSGNGVSPSGNGNDNGVTIDSVSDIERGKETTQ